MKEFYRDIDTQELFTESQLLEMYAGNADIYADEYGNFDTWLMAQLWQSGGNLETVTEG